ncbi:MAG: EAL domain-containing response regulator [Hyphomonadaceae bacterium]|nr:EAL domain-containing response regulator [Hyphomonadaceae bacterium]
MSYRQVLIVDDDPVFRALAEDLFLDAGCAEVAMAEDGLAALAKLDAGLAPDLLACDLNMPTHDGVSLIRALAERRFPGKVVVISGEPNPVIDSVAKLARMQGLNILGSIRKPLTDEALAEILSRGLATPKPSHEQKPATVSLLDAAIERGGLHPFFQAKVSMADGRISGAEALARIAVTSTDYANPIHYVELAERNNRIDDLTFVMTRIVALHAREFFVGGRPLPVSINISPVSLKRLDFPDIMASAVEGAGIPASQVTLEVTETRLFDYGPEALDIFARLRIKGFGLSVDDFGTGASNIDRLQMYPFTELKIDQTFTRNALIDPFARTSVEMSVRLAKDLGLKIVAEGVETRDMWDFLASLGVDEAQGYLMAKPMPPAEFLKLLERGVPQQQQSLRA